MGHATLSSTKMIEMPQPNGTRMFDLIQMPFTSCSRAVLRPFLCLLVGLQVFGLNVSSARAAQFESSNVEAELVSEVTSIAPGQSFWIALRQQIRPGWHTYWRNPGDSGAPTSLKWDLPEGFSASSIHWPYPERVPYGPLMNFGYEDEVVFPIEIFVPDNLSATQVTLKAKGRWLVCADICIPESGDLELTLPVTQSAPEIAQQNIDLFREAREKIPMNLGLLTEMSVQGDAIVIHVQMPGLEASRIKSIDYFPYEEGVLDFPARQKLEITSDGFKLNMTAGYDFNPATSTLDGIVVITEDSGEILRSAFEITPQIAPAANNEFAANTDMSIALAMFFAFLGGMILNLMPCVFPVLSIKFLSLVEGTHADAGEIRHHGIAYLFGVVLSFLAVAALLIALRAGGEEIGWGFQLQSPIVIGILVYLFVLIGLNLSGYFEFGLSLTDTGSALASRGGYAGSFYTGVLAAVVAAPCTAPFMGAAIGYALTLNALASLLIFAALGFGMALPYVLLCFSPPLLNRLPKPGAWMETLKEFFAFPMFATAIWLIWVLNQQTGADGLLAILAGLLLIGLGIWIGKTRAGRERSLVRNIMMITLFLSALMLTGVIETQSVSANATDNLTKEAPADTSVLGNAPYSPEKVRELVAEGPVFVNFTAAWCITCKVNDLAALSSKKVSQVFADNNVSYLVADWTNEDPVITRTLADYGRSGVPLYLLFPQGQGKAKVLPQILTQSIVIDAVESLKD